MGEKNDYFGQFRASKVYDGSIRGIEDNKTVGLRFNKNNALVLAKILLEYATADYSNDLILTAYKEAVNEEGVRVTAITPKQ
jgi:hypothetical protein